MEAENTRRQEPSAHPDGGYGWVIVGATIAINVTVLILIQCFGLIFRDEFAEWGVTSAEISFLLHLQSSLYCSFGFFTSPLLNKYGMRPVAFSGATLMCLGVFLSSFATSYIYLIFSVSILMGLGQGILMPATYLATNTYFKKKLTTAVSLSVTGATMSPIIMPKVCDILLSHIGRTGTVLLLFGISLLSLGGCYLMKPIKKMHLEDVERNGDVRETEGENHEPLVQTNPEPTRVSPAPANTPSSIWSKLFNIFDLRLLKDIRLVLVIVGLGVSFAAELNIVFMLQFILRELSFFSRSDVATAVSVQSSADILGRLVVPLVGNTFKAPSKFMYCGALIFASVGRTVLTTWSQSKIIVFMAIALTGLTKGCRAVYQSVIIPKYVLLERIPAANGLSMFFTGGVSLIIGPLIGAVHDQTNSYVYALHAASLLSLLCVILWSFESIFRSKRNEDENSESTCK